MANSVYQVNKGINRPIEFKGLRAQYIGYLGAGLVVLLVLFAALYLAGLPTLVCLGVAVVLGTGLIIKVYAMSRRYGAHGLMKAMARKGIPKVVRSRSRSRFLKI